VQLTEYNQLYEKAYLNEQRRALEMERKRIAEQKEKHEEEHRARAERLEEARERTAREQRGTVTSRNWMLLEHSAAGVYDKSAAPAGEIGTALFDFTLEFRVFEDAWTVIPLADAQLITDRWLVQCGSPVAGDVVDVGNEEPAWSPVDLATDTLLLLQEPEEEGSPRHVLATRKAGLYRVTFSAYVWLQSNRNDLHSFALNLLYPIKSTSLRLAHRAVVRELSVVPAAHCSVDEQEDAVTMSFRLPPTKTLEVKWRSVDVEVERVEDFLAQAAVAAGAAVAAAASEVQRELMQATVVHDALHSIVDGLLESNHTVKYAFDADQATLAQARILVRGTSRVTSVAGHGVLRWSAATASGSEAATLVEVSFKSSMITDTVILIVATETVLDGSEIVLPTLTCEDVLRQTGSLGIVKVANVEVQERETAGVIRVGIDELAEELRYLTNRPIMFAYKFLSPAVRIRLAVTKHALVEVMDAVVENALYETLVVDTQIMHRFMLVIQNSSKQYLEMRGMPTDARIWSVMVNSRPAKPVRGRDGAHLVPLLVGTANDGNSGVQRTSVEVCYLSNHAPLGNDGKIQLAPPKLAVPISTLLVEVQMPTDYKVEYRASLQQVARFSYPIPQPVDNDKGTDLVPHGFKFGREAQELRRTGVNMQVPKAGQCHRFEQLLVVDGDASVEVSYEAKFPVRVPAPALLGRIRAGLAAACERRRSSPDTPDTDTTGEERDTATQETNTPIVRPAFLQEVEID